MEQRTIGKFISTLRKAEGMTQRELAERLNVSDKTVSRWERDEGAPDISIIPVIAEIFSVTCDELLRGERKPQAERNAEVTEERSAKADKQRRRLLKLSLSQYKSRSYIAMAVSAAGFIAVLIANLVFLKALLGCLLGALFFVASLVSQAIFINKAFLSVEDGELEPEELNSFRSSVIRLGEFSIGMTVALFGFTLPLVVVGAYLGMGAESMFLYGSICAGALLLLYSIVLYFLNASLIKKGSLTLTGRAGEVYHINHRIKGRIALVLAVLLLATAGFHYSSTIIWGPGSIVEGTTFTDYESFIAFMEQDVPMSSRDYPLGTTDVEVAPAPSGEVTYYDEDGNVITEEEARKETLKDIDGNVVCEYMDYNENVCSLSYSPKDGTVLPITVKTYDDLYEAEALVSARNKIFTMAYAAELAAAFILYFIIRKRA